MFPLAPGGLALFHPNSKGALLDFAREIFFLVVFVVFLLHTAPLKFKPLRKLRPHSTFYVERSRYDNSAISGFLIACNIDF
jgi:hypothetical protein